MGGLRNGVGGAEWAQGVPPLVETHAAACIPWPPLADVQVAFPDCPHPKYDAYAAGDEIPDFVNDEHPRTGDPASPSSRCAYSWACCSMWGPLAAV